MTSGNSLIPLKSKRQIINSWKAIIHIAKKQLGLDDDSYRNILEAGANIQSCSQLNNAVQFENIMKMFVKAGYEGKIHKPRWSDNWGCSDKIRRKIEVMWRTISEKKTDASLHQFIKRVAGVDSPVFLNNKLAANIVQALSKMYRSAGLDPATGRKL